MRAPTTIQKRTEGVLEVARLIRDEDVGPIPIVESDRVVGTVTGQDLDEALRLIAKHEVRRLPVVEEDGKLIGIVAQADIAMHADASKTGEVLEKISN